MINSIALVVLGILHYRLHRQVQALSAIKVEALDASTLPPDEPQPAAEGLRLDPGDTLSMIFPIKDEPTNG